MTRIPQTPSAPAGRGWVDRLGEARPDLVLAGPFLVYVGLLVVRDHVLPYEWRAAAALVRGVGGLAVVWLFRRHLPGWGRPHWLVVLPAGLLAAWGWVAGQYFFERLGLPRSLPLPGGGSAVADPREMLGANELFWLTVAARVAVATVAVPIVEELFWRGFLLRALISWSDFERIPLGRFHWFSFLGTALLSALEHPGNWAVSIPCWLLYNALFCWKKSLLCVVLVHALTNFALYVYVVAYDDWMFW